VKAAKAAKKAKERQGDLDALPPFETPALNEVQQRAVDSLRTDGIAVVQFSELFDDAFWAELEADIARFVSEKSEMVRNLGPKPAKKEEFIVRRFFTKGEGTKPLFSLDSPWLRLALSESVLDIVNAYREQLTTLYYLDNWFTVPFTGADKRIASQRWHRDPEEAHVTKVFLYFSDVDEESGPFEYVKGSPAGNRYGGFEPWGEGDKHPSEDELNRATAAEDRVALTGPAGTMILCDTGGFHRGGFARTKPRILYASTYVSRSTGRDRRYEVEREGREAELPARVRAALA
jgi:phytanoyl-CoA dioxygenase PhyH